MIGGDGGQQITERAITEVIDGADLRFMFVVERQVVRQGVTERKRTAAQIPPHTVLSEGALRKSLSSEPAF